MGAAVSSHAAVLHWEPSGGETCPGEGLPRGSGCQGLHGGIKELRVRPACGLSVGGHQSSRVPLGFLKTSFNILCNTLGKKKTEVNADTELPSREGRAFTALSHHLHLAA